MVLVGHRVKGAERGVRPDDLHLVEVLGEEKERRVEPVAVAHHREALLIHLDHAQLGEPDEVVAEEVEAVGDLGQ